MIGATERVGAMGRLPVEYLLKYDYDGFIAPVNPKGGTVLGLPAFTSMDAIGRPIELALVMVPAAAVHEAVKDCAKAGASVCIVMSSGFAETGDEGALAQYELVQLARKHRMRLVGPNCIGAVGGPGRVLATFSPVFSSPATPLPSGNLALVSQSGALGFGALSLAMERGVPIGFAVTTGNEADVTATEVAAQLAHDPKVDAVLMYIESLSDFPALAAAAVTTPIAVVKAGRSEEGAKAAAWPVGLPGAMPVMAGSKKARLYKAMVLKVKRRCRSPFGKFSTCPAADKPKSPPGLCAGLGTSHRCAVHGLAAKRCRASGVKTKSGANTSPASTQNTSASAGNARTMPPAVSSA